MNIEIANRLQKLRKEHGYSQEELAIKLNVSRQAVSKWETTESSPDTDNLIAFAKLYGISLDELLGINDTNKKKNDFRDDVSDINEDDSIKINIENNNKLDKKSEKIEYIIDAIAYSLAIVFYIVFSAITGLWHPTRIVFFIPLIVTGIVDSILKKKIRLLPFALLMTCVYLYVGFIFNIWHPTWVLFCFIPLFGTFAFLFNNRKGK